MLSSPGRLLDFFQVYPDMMTSCWKMFSWNMENTWHLNIYCNLPFQGNYHLFWSKLEHFHATNRRLSDAGAKNNGRRNSSEQGTSTHRYESYRTKVVGSSRINDNCLKFVSDICHLSIVRSQHQAESFCHTSQSLVDCMRRIGPNFICRKNM